MTATSHFTNDQGHAANETAAAVLAGYELAGPQALDEAGRFHTVHTLDGGVQVIDVDALEAEFDTKHGLHPQRKTGAVHVHDADSFIAYLAKHHLPATEVYADAARQQLVAVVNAHEESTPDEARENKAGHGDHRVALELLPTPEWRAWIANDKKLLSQQTFAEHLEDNADDVVNPDAATMLEVAQSLIATTGVDFKQAVRLDNGQVQVRYEETTNARAGHAGDLEIPLLFTIAVAPFVGSDPVEVTARFRYRIREGNLSLSYALLRPELVARQAFLDLVEAVTDAITPPVFHGRPE